MPLRMMCVCVYVRARKTDVATHVDEWLVAKDVEWLTYVHTTRDCD